MVPSALLCLCQLADWDPDTEREETVLVLTACRETGELIFGNFRLKLSKTWSPPAPSALFALPLPTDTYFYSTFTQ